MPFLFCWYSEVKIVLWENSYCLHVICDFEKCPYSELSWWLQIQCWYNWANYKNLFEKYFKLPFPVILMMMFSHAFSSELDHCCCVCDIWCCSSPSSNWKMISYVIMHPTGLCYFLNGLYLNMVIPPSTHLNGIYLNFIYKICVLSKFFNFLKNIFSCILLCIFFPLSCTLGHGYQCNGFPFFHGIPTAIWSSMLFWLFQWLMPNTCMINFYMLKIFNAGYVVIWVYPVWFLVGGGGLLKTGFYIFCYF